MRAPAASPPVVRSFRKLLVANRGEIACRVMRTAHRLGQRTVAVYSAADRGAMHVAEADEAILLGAAPARESYLSAERIIAAARATGAEAVHPGYGFLSENAEFADACAEAGLVFVGPPASVIRAMGSKSAAKAAMERSGVPLVPGYHGDAQDDATLAAAAARIGYPLLVKASAGGGGKGMRIVTGEGELARLVAEAKRESASAFGDDRVLIEKYILRPRHIEVQVFGDTQGNVVSLLERECTLQRRHQKVVEEAPSPSVSPDRRTLLTAATRRAAETVGYVGAGTVEFVADDAGFYFIEMNTRLQVEHPVTEMITGVDLVEWQLRVAAGEPLPLRQDEIRWHGSAVEARVYAEDPARGFLPSVGPIVRWRQPAGVGVRIDTGFREGDVVTPYYDPMLAKVIAWAEDRPAALARLGDALERFDVAGVTTNLDFLQALAVHPAVGSNDLDTGFIEREVADLTAPLHQPTPAELAAAVARIIAGDDSEFAGNGGPGRSGIAPASPWDLRTGWTPTGVRRRTIELRDAADRMHVIKVVQTGEGMLLDAGSLMIFEFEQRPGAGLDVFLDGRKYRASVSRTGDVIVVAVAGSSRLRLTLADPLAVPTAAETSTRRVAAPMPGLVTQLLAPVGVVLERNTPILTIEAMKVVQRISAPSRGRVVQFRCAVGEFVQEGVNLVEFEPEEA